MKKLKRRLALTWSVVFIFSTLFSSVGLGQAAAATGNNNWQKSVFGDVGGQDKITANNFGITDNQDGSVTLMSANDRGKISGQTEGIAYYFTDVPAGANFELKATAHVDSWTANNQVSFGLMLRSEVRYDESVSATDAVYLGDYIAVGALDQKMKALYKENKIQFKDGLEYSSANLPAAGEQYELSIKKSGSIYVLKVNGETMAVDTYGGAVNYAGLYTARNTIVTFRDLSLTLEGQPPQLGSWSYSAFGGNTSDAKNPAPIIEADGSVTMLASGGKLAAGDEGLSFYYKELPEDANFEITAQAVVRSFNSNSGISTPNQKSFGLMLRDQVGTHGDASTQTSNYVAVGALDTVMKGVYKLNGTQSKLTPFDQVNPPTANEIYDLSIRKSGDTYVLTVNNKSETVTQDQLFQGELYAGIYVARDAEVTFRNSAIQVDARTVSSLQADSSSMRTEYLVNEPLDLSGLVITAFYSDGTQQILNSSDYIVTGYDSSQPGRKTITIHYLGASTTIDLEIQALSVTSLEIKYYPAKTEYYLGDEFDPEGLTVLAEYNNGAKVELREDQYEIWIAGQSVAGAPYSFSVPGTETVTITSTETPGMAVTFDVLVKTAVLTELEIRQQPAKTLYYIGDAVDLSGLIVYAKYDDQSAVRLQRQEYVVSALDTSIPGVKQMTITHKGKSVTFAVTVKVRELTGIEVTAYPRTTYAIGENFDRTGLVVSKVYDNLDKEILAESEYIVDLTTFNHNSVGIYEVKIIPNDTLISPIVLQVTVKEAAQPVWQSIRFGQSISAERNYTTLHPDGSIRLTALEGGGKVTGDHDGITFYYTELDAVQDNFQLSADIRVIEYAKNPHDGQESFGIMARDAIGTPGNASVFASNIAAVGGYSGSTRGSNGTQLFVRTGIEAPDGTGSQGVRSIMLDSAKPASNNTHPAAPYRLTLMKNNSGFTARINQGNEEIFYEPDILNVQNSKMYVGFFVARLATIEVSNIELVVSAAATDAPRVEPAPAPVAPQLEILSLDAVSSQDYQLLVRSNTNGVLTVKQGQEVIGSELSVTSGQILSVSAKLAAQGNTSFSLSFLPDETAKLTSYDKIVRNFTVTMRTYANGNDIYVSPTGSAAGTGTQAQPLDLDTAIQFVQPGQRIVLEDGRYVRSSKLEIKKYNDGTEGARKIIVPAPGARPILDFDKKSEGVVLGGSYWHIQGIDVTRSAGNTKGFTVGGSYNIIENSRFYANGDTGLQISRTDGSPDRAEWPSYNLILNSTAFDNRDPSDNNADGFAAKLTVGEGNVFRGTIAHNNIDDGWDLYTKSGTGAIGAVVIEDSIAYNNGFLTDGTVGAGDKNGFKLGGEGIHVPHIIRNSVAFGNGAYGFTSNSNPGVIAENNIAYNNVGGNLNLTTYSHITPDFQLRGFVSYQDQHTAKDNYPSSLHSDTNYLFNGLESKNAAGVKLSQSNFASLQPSIPYTRDSQGNIVWGDFLKFIAPVPTDPGTDPGANPDPGDPSPNPGSPGTNPGTPAPDSGTVTAPTSGSGSSGTNSGSGTSNAPGTVSLSARMNGNTAEAALSLSQWRQALASAALNGSGGKRIVVQVNGGTEGDSYAIRFPAEALAAGQGNQQLVIITDNGTVTLRGDLFSSSELAGAQTITLNLTQVSTDDLPALSERGNRPVVNLSLHAEGKPLGDSKATVVISIPYAPTAEELQKIEHLSIWRIDESGSTTPVVNAHYDAEAGVIIFTAPLNGQYAIVLVEKTFKDLSQVSWAKHQIEVLASKGIINGTSASTFSPGRDISRADFTLLLVRALGLTGNTQTPFGDVPRSSYFAEGVGIAQAHGIVNGQGSNQFRPESSITREEMFVMAARALQAAGWQPEAAQASLLDGFSDANDISRYAADDLSILIASGLVQGDARHTLRPKDESTRAEAAVFIYRLLQASAAQ